MALAFKNVILMIFWIPSLILCKMYKFLFYFFAKKIKEGRITAFTFNSALSLKRRYHNTTFVIIKTFTQLNLGKIEGELFMNKLYGIKPDQIVEYEPKGQEGVPQEERTIIFCKFLDVEYSAGISDRVYSAKGFGEKREELLKAGTQELEILRKGIVGWKNFKYADGSNVEWEDVITMSTVQKRNTMMDKNLNKMHPDLRSEIADFIKGGSTPSQD